MSSPVSRPRGLPWARVPAVSALVIVTMVMPAVASRAATAPPPSPWSQTGATAGNARANLTETTLTASSVKHVGLLRTLATSPPTDNCDAGIPRSPVLVGGAVYDISTGWINAYAAKTGALLWRHDLDPPDVLSDEVLLTDVAVADGLVIVGGDECDSNSDPHGVLSAYNAATGAKVWSATGGYGALDHFVVSGDTIVTTGSSVGSGDVITGYNLATGVEQWTQGGDSCGSSSAIAVHNVVVTPLCPDPDGTPELAAFTLSTGSPLWTRPGSWSVLAGSDHSANGHLYAQPAGGAITDLNAASGATRFTLAGATALLAVDNTTVYVGCGAGQVCGDNEATGVKVWQVSDPSTLAAEADGVLYLSDGTLLRAATGVPIRRLWNSTATSLAVGEGRIAVVKPVNSLPTTQLFGLPGE